MKLIIKMILISFVIFLYACEKEGITDPNDDRNITTPKIKIANDINASDASKKVYFRFSDSTVVTGADTLSDKWDIAFSTTTIYTNSGSSGVGNGGAVVLTDVNFEDVIEAPASGYEIDSAGAPAIPAGSGNGWYFYDFTKHLITPLPGVIIIVKTSEGKYAKVQILSYYKGAPDAPESSDESGFYTIKYFYQPDGSRKLN